MWTEENGVHVWAPPPKALRFLFVPTLILGAGGAVSLGGSIVAAVLSGGALLPIVALVAGFLFAVFMAVAAVFVLSARLRARFDPRTRRIHMASTSLIWSRIRELSFDDVTAVRMETVRSSSNAHQVNPVGTFAMILLVNPATKLRVQVSSERLDAAPAVAQKVADILGVPVEAA